MREKITEFEEFIGLTKMLLSDIQCLEQDFYKTLTGNKKAARRARVATVEFERKAKIFRKLSVKYINKGGWTCGR